MSLAGLRPGASRCARLCPALATGRSRFTTDAVTGHLLTNAAVIGQFRPACSIDIRGKKGQPGSVEVAGFGFR